MPTTGLEGGGIRVHKTEEIPVLVQLSILVKTYHSDEAWISVKLSERLFCEVIHLADAEVELIAWTPVFLRLLFSFNYETSSCVEKLCSILESVQVCPLWIYWIWAHTSLFFLKDENYLDKTLVEYYTVKIIFQVLNIFITCPNIQNSGP